MESSERREGCADDVVSERIKMMVERDSCPTGRIAMVMNMKKRINPKGILIVLGFCLVQSCIQQDLFRTPEPEITDQCITPL